MNQDNYLRIPAQKMSGIFNQILLNNGFSATKAEKCAEIFMENSLEGIQSHGVNRFERFIRYIKKGHILPDAEPSLMSQNGNLEQWDGNLGPGPLNALTCVNRSMHIAS